MPSMAKWTVTLLAAIPDYDLPAAVLIEFKIEECVMCGSFRRY
jgi:hypothetical protein